ncbi:MAG: hypothetical protein LUD17_11060 [Bacteroidales bacterium]|nr:hypothetical protein [Bacteroidales bacterium]
MNINLIISGNLTGFSRFFATPGAVDVLADAKFDFDYRNFVTFLTGEERAYALAFSPRYTAVSLITRILDSFRRPGILVVTVLVPRQKSVGLVGNPLCKDAVYRLLDQVREKFYDKNFLNGMVNQNPTVLMQDYYADILSNYDLVVDHKQRNINATADPASPNRKSGYISAQEKEVPKYLSSIYRKAYEGYEQVFIAPSATDNIGEPPEEIVYYRVKVLNTDRPLPEQVTLDMNIPPANKYKSQGDEEIPSEKFTYRQVVAREAEPYITATIEKSGSEEAINIKYNFPKEKKTINFKAIDDEGNEISLGILRATIEDNSTGKVNLASRWTFEGKEIYETHRLGIGNSEYQLDKNCTTVNVQKYGDDAEFTIYVRREWIFKADFVANDEPKTITFTNKSSRKKVTVDNVRNKIEKRLPGKESEWTYSIESKDYETITGVCGVGGEFKFVKKKTTLNGTSVSDNTTDREDSSINLGGEKHKTGGTSLVDKKKAAFVGGEKVGGTKVGYSETGSTVKGRDVTKGGFDFDWPENNKTSFLTNKNLILIGIVVAVVGIAGGIFWWILASQDDTAMPKLDEYPVTFAFKDIQGQEIPVRLIDQLKVESLTQSLFVYKAQQNGVFTIPQGQNVEGVGLYIKYLDYPVMKKAVTIEEIENHDLMQAYEINLPLTVSDMDLYQELQSIEALTKQELKAKQEQVNGIESRLSHIEKEQPEEARYSSVLAGMLAKVTVKEEAKPEPTKPIVKADTPKKNDGGMPKKGEASGTVDTGKDWPSFLEDLSATRGKLKSYQKQINSKKINAVDYKIQGSTTIIQRIIALDTVLNLIQAGNIEGLKTWIVTLEFAHLNKSQKEVVQNLVNMYGNMGPGAQRRLISQLKKINKHSSNLSEVSQELTLPQYKQ